MRNPLWKLAGCACVLSGALLSGPAQAAEPASGSFDGDGRFDVLARNASTGALLVYRHSGTTETGPGTFERPQRILGDTRGFRWIGQGDFNGDGHADVAGIDWAHRTLNVALNKGNGLNGTDTLAPAQSSGGAWRGTELVITGDVNHDGRADMIARATGTRTVYAYLNTTPAGQAKQTFAPRKELATSRGTPVEQEFADLTGDGKGELVSMMANGDIHMRDFTKGQLNPDGTRTGATSQIGMGYDGNDAFVVADVAGSPVADLLGRSRTDGTLRVHPNDPENAPPTGIFAPPVAVGFGWKSHDIIG